MGVAQEGMEVQEEAACFGSSGKLGPYKLKMQNFILFQFHSNMFFFLINYGILIIFHFLLPHNFLFYFYR